MQPLTSRQHLKIVLVMLCMVAIQANRKYVPYWLRPEFYALEAGQRAAFAKLAEKRIDVLDRPNLLVGDSMVHACRWADVDVISQPGASPQYIASLMAKYLKDHYYHTIIIWTGTAGRDEVLNVLPDAVADALPHAERVVILGPMPTDTAPRWFPKEALWFPLPQADAAKIVAQLRHRIPTATVLDVSFLRSDDANLSDGVHLSERGFGVLRARLEQEGVL